MALLTRGLHVHAAVDLDNLAGDVGRHVGSEEGCHIGDILDLAGATQGYFLVPLLTYFVGRAAVMAVSIKPGAMALARMPREPTSWAMLLASAMRPALEAA